MLPVEVFGASKPRSWRAVAAAAICSVAACGSSNETDAQDYPEGSIWQFVVPTSTTERFMTHSSVRSIAWLVTAHEKDEALIELAALGGTMRLRDVYAHLDLAEGERP
jgi:hypothetical protein